jgi:hypothetical protein
MQQQKQEAVNSLNGVQSSSNAFFNGSIKDRTTKESRKAAECLSTLKTISKNPSWKPTDNRTKLLKKSSATMQPCELARMRMQIGNTVPEDVIHGLTRDISQQQQLHQAGDGNSNGRSNFGHGMIKNPMLVDVEAEIQRRIHALGKSGKMFEDNAKYEQDQQMAADAEYLVRGIDPQVCIVYWDLDFAMSFAIRLFYFDRLPGHPNNS